MAARLISCLFISLFDVFAAHRVTAGVFAIDIYVSLHVEGSGHCPQLTGGEKATAAPLVRPWKVPHRWGSTAHRDER